MMVINDYDSYHADNHFVNSSNYWCWLVVIDYETLYRWGMGSMKVLQNYCWFQWLFITLNNHWEYWLIMIINKNKTYPLSHIPWPLTLIPYPYSLSPSTVSFKKFRWGFSLLLSLLLLLYQAKVKSNPSPRPKTRVRQY